MNIYDVIAKWGLDSPALDFKKFSRGAIALMANEVQQCYARPPAPALGRFHQSLAAATAVMENRKPIEELALPLLFSKQLLLPDPLYSALSIKANSTWNKLPESGNARFSDSSSISIAWKSYWSTPISARIDYLNATLPALIGQLAKLRPLVDAGFVVLRPWETAVESEIDSLRKAVAELKAKPTVINEITQRYTQANYNLGVRLGPLSIHVKEDSPSAALMKGDQMWVGDKTPILLMGLMHSLTSSRYSSHFIESLAGDRVIYDYVRTDGLLRPDIQTINDTLKLPDLSGALWPDIVAIKKDSELLALLEDRLSELAYCNGDEQIDLANQAIAELESKLRADAAFMKRVKVPFSSLMVGVVAGVSANLIKGTNTEVATIAGALTTVSSFAHSLVSDYFKKDNRALRKRRDLVIRVAGRLQ
jgi:hypothetical protein